MDYLDQERARGITIKSACTTFSWRNHQINLIDTPGHVDFTLEVERSVRVLDGAVGIIDGAAGVQAQTETVWKQAQRYQVPRIVFVNKMDKQTASIERCLTSLRQRLGVNPFLIQIPIGEGLQFSGVIDLIGMQQIAWNTSQSSQGSTMFMAALTSKDERYKMAAEARVKLIEQLAESDDAFADTYLQLPANEVSKDPSLIAKITPALVKQALRRITLNGMGTVVLCGASFRYQGVQPLLDAVVDFLPSPLDKPPVQAHSYYQGDSMILKPSSQEPLCALAFKVVNDLYKGVIVFVRVYSGALQSRKALITVPPGKPGEIHHTIKLQAAEKPSRVFEVHAKQTKEVEAITAGNIGAIMGMKYVRTGDTLVDGSAKNPVYLPGVRIPDPVYFCSVEPKDAQSQVGGIALHW